MWTCVIKSQPGLGTRSFFGLFCRPSVFFGYANNVGTIVDRGGILRSRVEPLMIEKNDVQKKLKYEEIRI